ncbi:MAG: hypothetical protein AAFO95_06525 [Cyanobacteria bacterium J06600_6]
MENLEPTYVVALAAILSVTLVSTLALTKDANLSGQVKLNENMSADFEAERLPQTKIDCLPSPKENNSQSCDNQ